VKFRRSLFFYIGLLLLVFISGLFNYSYSQMLGLTPAFIDANIQSGKTYKQEFTISNGSATRLRFRCSVGDYWYNEKNERVIGRPNTLPNSASSWVQFTPEEIIVEPNSSAVVKAVITVPSNAVGGYYTVPFFEGEPTDIPIQKDGKAGATFAVRMGGLLMLATEMTSEYNVEILSGKVVPPSGASEMGLQLDINNRSTAHARIRGMFAILDANGKMVGRGKIEEKRYLPRQHDLLKFNWGDELAPGHYTAVITLTFDRAGKEPATLVYELPFDSK